MVAEGKLRIFIILTVAAQPKPQVLRSRCVPWQHICLIRFLSARNITMFLERERSKVQKKTFLIVQYDTLLITFLVHIRKVWQQCNFVCYETNNSVVHISLDPCYTTHYDQQMTREFPLSCVALQKIEVTKMFIKNKEIMNKSALFRLKLSFPNVSGLALHQWNYQFVETVARSNLWRI